MTPYHESNSFSDVESQFETALAWLSEHKVNFDPTRLGHYRVLVSDLVKRHTASDFTHIEQHEDDFYGVLFEAHEIIEIHRGLRDLHVPGLPQRLKMLAEGPKRRQDEAASRASIIGRNTAFELLVASRYGAGGLEPDLSRIGDVGLSISGKFVVTECKRPSSRKKILENFQKAIKQCHDRIRNSASSSASGIAALDFSWVANPDSKTLYFPNALAIEQTLASIANSFVSEFAPQLNLEKERKILGILVRFASLVVDSEKATLNHAQHWGLVVNSNASSRRLGMANSLAKSMQASIFQA